MARDAAETTWFSIIEYEKSTRALIEGGVSDRHDVLQDGSRIKCGRQRQAAQDAGGW